MGNLKNQRIYLLICLAVFASGLSTGSSASTNMLVILNFELFVIALCILSLNVSFEMLAFLRRHILIFSLASLLLIVVLIYYYFTIAQNIYIFLILFAVLTRDLSPYYRRFKTNKLLTVLVFLWLVSISISFYGSPLGVADVYLNRVRFEQTIVHLVCFFSLLVFLGDNRLPGIYLLLVIPASILAAGAYSLYLYAMAETAVAPQQWFAHPPFSAHIRHVGYQVTAGLSILLALFAGGRKNSSGLGRVIQGTHFIATALLWAFLFWCGGRSSIASVLILLIVLGLILWRDTVRFRSFSMMVLASAILGLLLSDWLSVFPWNGLYTSIERTVGVGTVYELTSSRSHLWALAWNAAREYWLFGLGSNAYLYIPGVPDTVGQPHGMLIQFFTEWGVVGSLLFLMMLVLTFFRGLRTLMRSDREKFSLALFAAGSAITSLTIHGMADGTYFHAKIVFTLAILFAIWLSPHLSDKESII